MSIYINEACRINYLTVLTGPPLTPSKLIMFMETDACVVHFSHNDALIVTMHIDNCRVSRILVDNGSSIDILYRGALDRIEDTLEAAQAMINPQTQSKLYGLTRMRLDFPARSYFRSALIYTMLSWSFT